MDLRRFITLKTVVEEGSFLRASQKLCCTQSTVTFHIQQLEQEFSVQLFEKIGRRMCLTREGKKLLPHIYELTRVMDTLREAAKKESDPDGELRVVSGETLLSYRIGFAPIFPDICYHLPHYKPAAADIPVAS
ncbi:LysR family transcriptional regulator, partial [Escherichia coli]|uniref:LysR family transcriptional regulator n=1 Tax=Escherichia coli TaxID=562 RepID=UPI003EE3CA44